MRIVLDTNVFINIIGTISPYRWILDKIISNELTLCLSNEIFFEYWEVLEGRTSSVVAKNITNFLVVHPSVILADPFLQWHLIHNDPDDNKFVDCYLSSSAECIITHDNHFDILKTIPFPKIKIFTPEEFAQFYYPLKNNINQKQ